MANKKSVIIWARVTDKDCKALRILAEKNDRTMSDFIRLLIKKALESK